MDPMVIAGIVAAVASLIGTGVNAYNQYKQRKQQDNLTSLQMQREDSSMQRQATDLKKAGLSPLLVSGGSPTGQLVASPSPTLDFSGFQNAMSDMIGRKQNQNQFDKNYRLQLAQLNADLQTKKLQNEMQKEQIKAQRIANKYNEIHGLRDPSWQNALVDIVEGYMSKHNIDLTDDVSTNIKKGKTLITDRIKESYSNKVPESVKNILDEYLDDIAVSDLPISTQIGVTTGEYIKKGAKKAKTYVSDKVNSAKEYVSDKVNSAKEYVTDKKNKAKKWVYKKIFSYNHN